MATLDDCAHVFGSDLQTSSTGDIGRVNGADRSKQRVLRRLLTNPGSYLSHPTYGAGLGLLIGTVINIPTTQALIKGQMLLEPSVSRSPEPTVAVTAVPNGVSVQIEYVALPDKQPVALSFKVV